MSDTFNLPCVVAGMPTYWKVAVFVPGEIYPVKLDIKVAVPLNSPIFTVG